jgi:hypothetical protein
MAPAEGAPGRSYAPLLTYPGLFRSLANATADANGFLKFANQYGNLYETCSLFGWHSEVLAMRQAIKIWDCLRQGDERTLSEHFKWSKLRLVVSPVGETGWVFPPDNATEWALSYDSHPKMRTKPDFLDMRTRVTLHTVDPRRPWCPELAKPHGSVECPYSPASRFGYDTDYPGLSLSGDPDVFVAARFYLSHLINQRINNYHAYSALTVVEVKSKRRSPTTAPGGRLKKVQATRVLVPVDLLGAIWLQFENTFVGNKEERTCLECGKPFVVARGEARSDKTRCSSACRSKARRRRLKEG